MLTAIEGVFRNGKIVLKEIPKSIGEDTPVIVTFLTTSYVDLQAKNISEREAAELRERLATFSDDWEHNDMDIYDEYEANKESL